MINGFILDPRAWAIDFKTSGFWNPDKYGVHIDLHANANNIPKIIRSDLKRYSFCLATEVWEFSMRDALKYVRSCGLKVFLAAREPIKYGELVDAMFAYNRFNRDGEYYFKPDAVFAAGQAYADLWRGKTKTYVTGYPRWDWYIDGPSSLKRDQVAKKYGLEVDRKWIFFPDYPPYHYKKVNGNDTMIDLFDEREKTIETLLNFAKKHSGYQVVSKIHPASMKPFLKKTGRGNEVGGLLKYYYTKPTKELKVIGDDRMKGMIARELLTCADFVVGYNSTMLLEAMILNKPVVSVMLGKCQNISSPYSGMSSMVFDTNGITKALEMFDAGKYIINKSDMVFVNKYMHNVDGRCCKRMCKAIKSELVK